MIGISLNTIRNYFLVIILITIHTIHYTQCNNGTNFFPATVQYPTLNQWWSATANNWAGEIIKIGVTMGENYQFSTCATYGNVQASYDTELTLRDQTGTLLSFNDDYIGCGNTSYINWTATFNGEVHLHINDQNCATNSTLTEVMIFRSPISICNPPVATYNKICQSNSTYDIDINLSSTGSASSVNISNLDSIYFSNVQNGNYTINGLSGISNIKIYDFNDSTCYSSQGFSICNPCTNISAPSDFPCNAPSLNLLAPFYGSTNCGYSVSSGGNSNGPDNFCGNSNNDSWLVFTASDDTIVLDWNIIYDPINGCDQGVQFAILEGNCNNEDQMVELACYNPAGIFQNSGTFTIPDPSTSANPLTIGQDYYIYIDGYSGDLCDYYWIAQYGIATNLNNDSCGNAQTVSCGFMDTSNNILSSNSNIPPSCSTLTPGKGVWYEFTGDGSILTTSTSNPGTNFDTQIHVYQGTCDSLIVVGCDDNSGNGNSSEYSFLTVNGVQYYIYVNGNGTETGQFVVSFSCQYCDLSISTIVNSETCEGENDGEILIDLQGTSLYNIDTNGTSLFSSVNTNNFTINNLKDGNYNLSIYDLNILNCDTGFSVSINPGNSIYNVNFDTVICNGSSVLINNNTYNGNNPNGVEILNSINGCDSTVNITITELADIFYNFDTLICENDSLIFNNQLYSLSNPNGLHIFTAQNGCDSSVNVSLDFFPATNITSNFNDTTVCEDDTILVFGIGASDYYWNNNILDSIPFISPVAGQYIVSGTDSNNCIGTYNFQLDTEFCPREPFSILIPNVLTANQDGVNDIFMVSGTSYEFISMRIFNRWGQQIFSDFSGRGWDGRLPSGLKAKTGSYNFILEIQPLTRPVSNSEIYKGNIELFNN